MKRIFLISFLALVGFLQAQGPNDPNEGARITTGTASGNYLFSWFGHAGNTYFIQKSTDLQTWSYFPVIKSGSNQIISWGFPSANPKFFLRLKYTNIPTTDPFNADFDNDGVNNWNELLQGTDPLVANLDTNGLPLDWEKFYGILLGTNPNALAPRGDGLTYMQAFQQTLNPNDYFNGVLPTLSIVSGSNQTGMAGVFLPQPLIIKLSGTNGSALSNAPVIFSLGTAGGQISTDELTLSSSLQVRTGTNGQASIYFQLPSGSSASVVASVTTGTQTVQQTFVESISQLPIGGLHLWLKADMGISGSGSAISSWHDYSGLGNNATQVTSGQQPTISATTSLNGNPVVHFNVATSQNFVLPDFMSSGTAGEIFAVVRASSKTLKNGLWRFGTKDVGDWYGDLTGNISSDFGSNLHMSGAVPSQDITQFHIYELSSQPGLWQSWIDGVPLYTSTVNTVAFTTGPRLGAVWDGGSWHYFSGDMAEVIVYNRTLSVSERKSTIAYLNQKYALIAAPQTPTGLSVAALSPTQNEVTWNWQQTGSQMDYVIQRALGVNGSYLQIAVVNGVGTYVDTTGTTGQPYYYRVYGQNAGGISGTTSGVTASNYPIIGGSLSMNGIQLWLMGDGAWENPLEYWHDYSGYGNDAWQTAGGQQPTMSSTNTLNGKPVIHFDATSSQNFVLPDFMSSGTAGEIFAVVRASSKTIKNGLWRFGTKDVGDWYGDSSGNVSSDFGSNLHMSGAVPSQDITQFHIYELSSQPGLWQSWIDGVSLYTNPVNTVAFTTGPRLGAVWTGGAWNYFSGDMAEVIVYNRSLNDLERERVRNYLAIKYLLPSFDVNGDGLTTAQDQALGLDPLGSADVNGDGVSNGGDVAMGISPTNLYLNGNGYTNAQNIAMGIDPFTPYTPPVTPPSDPNDHTAPTIILITPPDAVLLP